MSATTTLIIALAAFFAAIADLAREGSLLTKIADGVRGWWRRKHPLPQTPQEAAAAQEIVIDGRIIDLKEHVKILRDLAGTATAAAATANQAAAAAQRSAGDANRSAAAAQLELARLTAELERWHQWAVRWWPVLRNNAESLGVPDPPAMDPSLKETT